MASRSDPVPTFRNLIQKNAEEAIDISTAVSIAIDSLKRISKLVFTYHFPGKGFSFCDELNNTYSIFDGDAFEKELLSNVAKEGLSLRISTKDRRGDLYIMPGIATKTIQLCRR